MWIVLSVSSEEEQPGEVSKVKISLNLYLQRGMYIYIQRERERERESDKDVKSYQDGVLGDLFALDFIGPLRN